MPRFKRQRGEPPTAWAARLARENVSTLAPEELDDLTLRRVLAERAAKREALACRKQEQATNGLLHPESADLRQCKESIRALSDHDRLLLIQWIQSGLAD